MNDALNSKLERWAPAAVVLLAFVLYLNILPNTFIFDDWQQIFENPYLRQAGGIQKIFTSNVWAFEDKFTNYYRPLMHLTFYAGLHSFGFNPAGYHLISILLHAMCSLLVYLLVKQQTADIRVALGAGLLFAAHPVHTENVAWISAYPDLYATLFVLLGWVLYLRLKQVWLRAAAVGGCFFLGLLAKEIAVVLPVVLVAQAVQCRMQNAECRITERWRDFLALAAAFAAYVYLRVEALGGLLPYAQTHQVATADRIYTSLALFGRYWAKLVWPAELNMFPDVAVSHGFFEGPVIAGTLVLLAFAAAIFWLWRKQRVEMLGLLLFAGALAPAFSLPYGDINLMAERYLYLPSVGFCWLLARYWPSLLGAKAATAVFLVLVTAGSARTVVRNLDYRDEVGFYRKTLEMSPRLAEVHILLGSAYMRRNNLPDALVETQRAAELKPRSAEAHNNLGIIHSRLNRPQEAIGEFNRSAELAFEDGHSYAAARSYTNLGAEYRRLGQLDMAIEAYGRALKILPTLTGALNNRGYALLLAGRVADAEADFRRAIEQDPSFAPAHSNMGLLRMHSGNLEGAMSELLEALRLGARDAETYARLAEVAAARGDTMGAQGMFRKALELDPENERAKQGMARMGAGK